MLINLRIFKTVIDIESCNNLQIKQYSKETLPDTTKTHKIFV